MKNQRKPVPFKFPDHWKKDILASIDDVYDGIRDQDPSEDTMAETTYNLTSLADGNQSIVLDKTAMLRTFLDRLEENKLDSMNHYEKVLKYSILAEMALYELGYTITSKREDD